MYLKISGINKAFCQKHVLKDIDLQIEKGSFVTLVGSSGSGKTTLLRTIAGFENADSGKIELNGREITNLAPQHRNIGFVFQNFALFPHKNVFDNVAYGLAIKKVEPRKIAYRVDEILEKVNLRHKSRQNVTLLSGGEQQRVALARALVIQPEVLLLDEPLSNLDHSLRLQARNALKKLQNDIGITTIYVTHDQTEALAMSDMVSVMHSGRIVQIGSPYELYNEPTNLFTAQLVGHYNIFTRSLADQLFNYILPQDSALAVLPESMVIEKSANKTDIVIKDILFGGAFSEFILSAKETIFTATMSAHSSLNFCKGDYVSLSVSNTNIKIIHS